MNAKGERMEMGDQVDAGYSASITSLPAQLRDWLVEKSWDGELDDDDVVIDANLLRDAQRLWGLLNDAERAATFGTDCGADWVSKLLRMDDVERRQGIAVVDAMRRLRLGPDQAAMAEFKLNPAGKRRTGREMYGFRMNIYRTLAGYHPMTVRQVFYQLVTKGLEKTENAYQRVQQEILNMRDEKALPSIPWSWIVDGTRWMRKPRSYTSVDAMLDSVCETYRRDLWQDQDVYVELWCEKDALAGVLYEATGLWDVPLMVARGFSSATFCHSAAQAIREVDKPAYIYLFVDNDRAGRDIARSIEKRLRQFAPQADIACELAAVTAEQIESLGLPTRPPKRKGDPPATELDAIPPGTLKDIARDCIEQHIDADALRRTQRVEEQERQTLVELISSVNGGRS